MSGAISLQALLGEEVEISEKEAQAAPGYFLES